MITAAGFSALQTVVYKEITSPKKDIIASIIYSPAAGADNFYANGLLYQYALSTLDQETKSALAAVWNQEGTASKVASASVLHSPTLNAASTTIPHVSNGSTVTTLTGTAAATAGTVTSSAVTIKMWKVDSTGIDMVIEFSTVTTLAAAVAGSFSV